MRKLLLVPLIIILTVFPAYSDGELEKLLAARKAYTGHDYKTA